MNGVKEELEKQVNEHIHVHSASSVYTIINISLHLTTAPSDVVPPSVAALSSTSLQVTWTEPITPNGNIVRYSLFNVSAGGSAGTLLTNSPLPGSHAVDGLEPYTEYGFIVEVCTTAGCTDSAVGSGFTEESGKLVVVLI